MPKYLMRPGTLPGTALWSRCEDELLCRAELLFLMGQLPPEVNPEQAVFGYYEIDRKYTIADFKRAYRGRSGLYRQMMAARKDIIANGWPYPVAQGGEGDPGVDLTAGWGDSRHRAAEETHQDRAAEEGYQESLRNPPPVNDDLPF